MAGQGIHKLEKYKRPLRFSRNNDLMKTFIGEPSP
jgi:hypothetical protein